MCVGHIVQQQRPAKHVPSHGGVRFKLGEGSTLVGSDSPHLLRGHDIKFPPAVRALLLDVTVPY